MSVNSTTPTTPARKPWLAPVPAWIDDDPSNDGFPPESARTRPYVPTAEDWAEFGRWRDAADDRSLFDPDVYDRVEFAQLRAAIEDDLATERAARAGL
jgi:hypothetical protein